MVEKARKKGVKPTKGLTRKNGKDGEIYNKAVSAFSSNLEKIEPSYDYAIVIRLEPVANLSNSFPVRKSGTNDEKRLKCKCFLASLQVKVWESP